MRQASTVSVTFSLPHLTLTSDGMGFAGGVDSYGRGTETPVLITAQEGVGSGLICDVLVYGRPD